MANKFADNIFQQILLNEKKFYILLQISLVFVPEGSIDNTSALVQVTAWKILSSVQLYFAWNLWLYVRLSESDPMSKVNK